MTSDPRGASLPDARPPHPPFATVLLLALAAVRVALLFATRGQFGWFRDEFYFIACGHHPAWGYVDQPPLTPMLALVAERIAGGSAMWFRVLPALAHAGVILLAGAMARELKGGAFAQGVAAVAALAAPVLMGTTSTLCIPAFDELLWAGCLYVFLRVVNGAPGREWLWFGVLAGLALLNKQSVALFLGALLVGMALTPARGQLRGGWLRVAAAIAAAMALPNVLWEIQNHWPTLEFLRNASEQKNVAMSPLQYLRSQELMMSPAALPLWLTGLGMLLFSRSMCTARGIGIAYLLLLAFFCCSHAKNYYLAPAYAPLLAAGAVGYERAFARGWLRMLRPVAVVLMLGFGVLTTPLVLPVLSVEGYVAYAARLGYKEGASERHAASQLPQTYSDMFGWQDMVAQVARTYHSLSPAERDRCVIFANNYGEAAAIDFFGPQMGLPHAISGHNSYYLWGPGTRPADVVITVGESAEDVGRTFGSVVQADSTRCEYCMPYEDGLPILVGRQPKVKLLEIWPRCKHFI